VCDESERQLVKGRTTPICHAVIYPVRISLFAVSLTLCIGMSLRGDSLPDVAPLPPEWPGVVFCFGEGRIPPSEGETGDGFPYDLGPAGDVDGDGYDDLFCAATPQETPTRQCETRIYLIHGHPSPPKTLLLAGPSADITLIRNPGSRGAVNIAPAGDLDADGFDDILISTVNTCFDDDCDTVRVLSLIFGSPSFPERLRLDQLGEHGVRLLASPRCMLTDVVSVGDIDGDGFDDLTLA
jgi:hypothetical protein